MLVAKCRPMNNPKAYLIQIEFSPGNASATRHRYGIKSWRCTCPDWGNPCKHIGGLLLLWSQMGGKGVPRKQTWEEFFESKPPEEIKRMLWWVAENYPKIGGALLSEFGGGETEDARPEVESSSEPESEDSEEEEEEDDDDEEEEEETD